MNTQQAYNNWQQAAVQPANGYANGNYPPVNNGQPVYNGQPAYNHYNQPVMSNESRETEPAFAINADYSTHREGEYDQYPDFPGYPENNTYNHQNR